ncbi:MAG: adenylate/guanylate cyclase domain-containing protein [Alsobacter sp.]
MPAGPEAPAVQRRLSVVLVADVVGSSRLMEADEAFAMESIRDVLSGVLGPVASRWGGRLFKSLGDGALIEFASPVSAVQTAIEVQTILDRRAAGSPPERRIVLRIGINLGDVVVQLDGDLHGDGVNVAARIEGLSPPGGVSISAKVREELHGKMDAAFVDGGERRLKGISRPVRIFTWSPQGAAEAAQQPPGRSAALRPSLALPDKPSIAVLPFANLSGDPEQEYLAEGIAEDIITALSRIQAFFVIARNSSFSYKRKPISTQQVGRELGVRYVLEGSVRKAGDRLRITGQMVEAETGRHVWAERFDGVVTEVFELQDKVTSAIAGAMEPNLRVAELGRVRAKPTTDFTAYDLYLNALFLLSSMSRTNHVQAQALLRQALDLDPDYAEAMAALSLSVGQSVLQGWSDDSLSAALTLSRRAAQIAPHSPGVLAIAAASEALHTTGPMTGRTSTPRRRCASRPTPRRCNCTAGRPSPMADAATTRFAASRRPSGSVPSTCSSTSSITGCRRRISSRAATMIACAVAG